MRHSPYVFTSLLIASVVPAVLFTVVSSIFDSGFRGWVVIIFPFVLLTTVVHTLLLGGPAFLVLRKFNILHWWSMALAGFIIGGLPIPLGAMVASWFRQGGFLNEGWMYFIESIFAFGCLGVIGGLTFWFAWNNFMRKNQV